MKNVVAYILKGYPRISETFILNEIYLLERSGQHLHIFSVKNEGEKKSHEVVRRIATPVTYLPEDTSVMDSKFSLWLVRNFPRFAPSHARLFLKRPLRYFQALFYALFGLSLKISLGRWPLFKRSFIKDFFRAGYMALKVLEADDIGHLHGHFAHGSTTMTMLVSHITGIPYSFTAHAKDIYVPKLNPKGLLQTKLERAEFAITCTDYNRQHLRNLWPEGTPIYTLYHGLDTNLFQPPVNEPKGPITILSVGRFVEKKGFPYLLEACRLLRDKGLAFHCHIIGQEDEDSERVGRMIQDYRLENVVQLEGGMTQEELREAYRQSHIFALPCFVLDSGDRDGIPNVLAEAMATGRAVVSSNISGIPEIVTDEVNGLLIPQKDVEALAVALERLLKDADLRRRLGAASRETICEVFDSRKTTSVLKDLFADCLERFQAQHTVGAQGLAPLQANDVADIPLVQTNKASAHDIQSPI